MRVIAGPAGGIQLDVPRKGVRTTMDRVKAAIFSSLGDDVIGGRVLDLFAGSGGLGIEALSRGAERALFVDHDRVAINAIQKNLAKSKLEGETLLQDVFQFLNRAQSLGKFRLIFADPPYDRTADGESYTDKLLHNFDLPKFIEQNGTFVLEKRPEERLPEFSLWNLVRQKTYGATEVLFLSVASTNPK